MTELTLLWPVDYNADLDIQSLDGAGRAFKAGMTNFLKNNSVWYSVEFQDDYARILMYIEGNKGPVITAALNQVNAMRAQGVLVGRTFYAITSTNTMQSI